MIPVSVLDDAPPIPLPVLRKRTPARIRVGSLEHRDLLASEFRATHRVFDPDKILWPEIERADVERLRSLPVWEEAVRTEHATARLVTAYAARELDPTLREIVALQGFEESRHSLVIDSFVRHYGLHPVPTDRPEQPPEDLDEAFLRMGYGECMDSFFAFGLFQVARRSGLFPPSLVDRFDPILQEEARHILFFVNWLALRRARLGFVRGIAFRMRCTRALVRQLIDRIKGVRGMGGENPHFTNTHHAIDFDVKPVEFVDLCLAENERRLSEYDERLLRPRLVPWVVRRVRWLVAFF